MTTVIGLCTVSRYVSDLYDLYFYFLVVISVKPCFFVVFCQRFIYKYMDMDLSLFVLEKPDIIVRESLN